MPIIIQERDVPGLPNPLDVMRPYSFFATTLHYMIPSLKIDLKTHMLGYDDTYTVGGIALIYDDDTYSPHASLMLNGKYHPHVSVDLADFYHPKQVLYSYAYVTGYSIDDLEGIIPTTCIVSLVECFFRFLLVHDSLHADQVRDDIPWDPGGPMAWG